MAGECASDILFYGKNFGDLAQAFGSDLEPVTVVDFLEGDGDTRNAHIDMIAKHGRMAWQKATGYGQGFVRLFYRDVTKTGVIIMWLFQQHSCSTG